MAIYVRVCSRSQDTRSQEHDLRGWARAQAEKVTWYRDHHTARAWSGRG